MATIRDINTKAMVWKTEGVPTLEIKNKVIELAAENGFPKPKVSGTDEAFDLDFGPGGVIHFDGSWNWSPK